MIKEWNKACRKKQQEENLIKRAIQKLLHEVSLIVHQD